MAEKMLWNKDKTASVKASKIREIRVTPTRMLTDPDKLVYVVAGWYNKDEAFHFGDFGSKSAANRYVNKLHDRIEGK